MSVSVDGSPVPGVLRVAVHERQRFFRLGLARLLAAAPEVDLVGVAVTPAELARLCASTAPHLPDVVILELDDPTADPCRTASSLRSQHRGLRFVGLTAVADPLLRPAV